MTTHLLGTLALTLLGCGPRPEDALREGLALVDTDPSGAAAQLAIACDAGITEACVTAGALPVEYPAKPHHNELGCEAGVAAACARRSTAPDDAWTARACTLGDGESCARRAAAVTDPAERQELLVAACRGNHLPACLPAGDGARTAGDNAVAAELYGVRCAAEPDSTACTLAARVGRPTDEPPWPPGPPDEVSAALWKRCAADEAWACLQLSEHVGHGGPLPKDARGDAGWLRDQACDLQLDYACAPHRW